MLRDDATINKQYLEWLIAGEVFKDPAKVADKLMEKLIEYFGSTPVAGEVKDMPEDIFWDLAAKAEDEVEDN